MNLDPAPARDPRLPRLPRCAGRRRGGRASWSAPALRPGLPGARRHPGAAGRRGPPTRAAEAAAWPSCSTTRRLDDEAALAPRRRRAALRSPRPVPGSAARPARPPRRSPTAVAGALGEPARGPWSPPARTPGCCARCSSRGARCRSWPGPGPALPGWAGGLDLVVVLAPEGSDTGTAVRGRRGGPPRLPRGGRLPAALAGRRARRRPRHAPCCPRSSGDQLATAVVMLEFLDRVDLGPDVRPRGGRRGARRRGDRLLAVPRPRGQPGQDARDRARRRHPAASGAARCSPPAPAAGSPSRSGGPAAARRSPATPSTCCRCIAPRRRRRRVRRPVRRRRRRRAAGPALVVLDDGSEDADGPRAARPAARRGRSERGVRVRDRRQPTADGDVARYAALLLAPGTYAAAYLGRSASARATLERPTAGR